MVKTTMRSYSSGVSRRISVSLLRQVQAPDKGSVGDKLVIHSEIPLIFRYGIWHLKPSADKSQAKIATIMPGVVVLRCSKFALGSLEHGHSANGLAAFIGISPAPLRGPQSGT
jgi:hypothetical protein